MSEVNKAQEKIDCCKKSKKQSLFGANEKIGKYGINEKKNQKEENVYKWKMKDGKWKICRWRLIDCKVDKRS